MSTGGWLAGATIAAGLAAGLAFAPSASNGEAGAVGASAGQGHGEASMIQEAPAVTVEDFAWLEGRWIGEGPEGATAEIHYLAPKAGVLVGTFRLVQADRLIVLELITLVNGEEGVEMRVRHFDGTLTVFEEDHPLTLVLQEAGDDLYRFRNVYEGEDPVVAEVRVLGPDRHVSWSRLEHQGPDGPSEIEVEYRRVGG